MNLLLNLKKQLLVMQTVLTLIRVALEYKKKNFFFVFRV